MDPPIPSEFSQNKTCIICKKSNDDKPGLKIYTSKTAVRNAAEKRCSLTRDKFEIATKDILSFDSSSDMYYHSQCHSQYCAVKRKLQDLNQDAPSTSNREKSLRSKSDLPHSSPTGVLAPSCILCSFKRKRNTSSGGSGGSGSFEILHKVMTLECSKMLVDFAKQNPNSKISQRILSLGSEELVAKEAHYHNSCRVKFLKEESEKSVTSKKTTSNSFWNFHEIY